MKQNRSEKHQSFMPGRGHGGPGAYMRQPKVKVKNVRGVIKRLWVYLAVMKFRLIAVFGLVTLTILFQIAGPYFQGIAIDKGIIAGNREILISTVLVIGIIYLFSGFLVLFQNLLMADVSQRVVRNLRNNLFYKLQTLSLRYFDKNPHGELMSRVSNDIDLISQTLTSSLTQIISSFLSVAGVGIMMIILNFRLALIALITIPLILLLTRFIAGHTRKGFKKQQQLLGNLNGHIEESVSGLRTVKLFGTEDENLKSFTDINGNLRKAAIKANIYGGVMGPIMNLMRNVNYAIVAFAGGYLAFNGLLSIGLIAVFLQYTRQFSRPLNQIAQLYNSIQSALAGAERVFAIIDENPEISNAENPVFLSEKKGDVEFCNVDFSYIPGQPVLKNLSFRAKTGQTIAIVGETGAGKTTIVNLLTRFYDIDSGEILIDGNRIKNIDKNSLRRNLGFVLQDTFLFSDTVKENIRYGKPDASDEEVIHAASLANAHHFIHRLPDGYETKLSAEGNNLSEGQKQLLAIARVILSDPSILILDEATSSVDTRTEIHIQEALLALMKGRTSFVIAHRLSTIRNADVILVLDKGEIIEKGNHDELLANRGVYYGLYSAY